MTYFYLCPGKGGGCGTLQYKEEGGCSSYMYLLGIKIAVNLKRSIAEAFVVPFNVLNKI